MDFKAINLLIDEYDYPLPAPRIAEFPLSERDESRLLVYNNGRISDHLFKELDQQLPEDSLLILNDTRVIQARIFFKKSTGGIIELFLLEPHNEPIETSLLRKNCATWNCLIGGASKWKPGQILSKEINIESSVTLSAKYISKEQDHFVVELSWNGNANFSEIIDVAGSVPLPPYIKRESVESDKSRYQTIFSKHEGSVAAPTAALHFTESVFRQLKKKNIQSEYITLHVGAGTFKPVKTSSVAEHHMHEEPFTIKKSLLKSLLKAKTVILVGTTTLRTLESMYWLGIKLIEGDLHDEWKLNQWEAYSLSNASVGKDYKSVFGEVIKYMDDHEIEELHCNTSLMIVHGYLFQVPDALITNFHQPKSTLLLLVSAFTGNDWKKIYTHALENDYRFLSYGDGSLLWRKK